jgi:MYXO-CTERM domain-containing protein
MASEKLQALALAFPIIITALVPDEAEACPGPGYDPCADFDFWQSIAPLNAAKIPADGVLVLQGAHVGGVDADWLTKIELTVTKDGQPIAGALAATSAHGLLIWRPDAPWTPGATYQMSGLVTNPDFGGTYCGEATLPFAADLLIDTEIAATLEPVEFSANVMTQIDPFVTLGTLACCPGATPSEQYGGCGANTVLWDETTCAPTRTNGYLNVTLTGMPAAAGPAADQILYTLKIDGGVHSSSLIPSFAGIYATTAICAVIEAQDLASGKVTVSEEQCFGEDMADVLGVHPQDPSKTLACALQQCEIVNEMWDPMNCTPYDPENVPTTSDTMSSSGSDSGVSEDGDKGCACHTTPANNAGLLALVAIVGLTRRRRGRR